MFIIYGTRTLKKRKFTIKETQCPICSERGFSIMKVTKFFSLFYLPLIPYSSDKFVTCNSCNIGFEINSNEYKDLKESKDN